MTRKRKTATRATPARRPRKQRGSTMLMVVVILFMLAIMGTAYLQYARIQRFASGADGGDIDAVINSAMAQIKGQLADDIAYGPNFAPYDYPWTNQNLPATRFDSSTVNVPGGKGDDYWLADSSPIFATSTTATWNHISNITGLFLRYDSSTNRFLDIFDVPITPGALPEQDIVSTVTNLNTDDTDTGMEILGSTKLADADGDGIPDSRWTWAPIRQINGVTYVMAVRVVDLSSLINVNTALSTIDASGAFDTSAPGTNAPHWDTPGEVDLGSFIYGMGIDAGDTSANVSEFDKMLGYRFGFAAGTPAGLSAGPLPWQNKRTEFWKQVGRLDPVKFPVNASAFPPPQPVVTPPLVSPTNSTSVIYGVNDEYNLRRFNGINDNTKTPGPLETTNTGLPTFLQTTIAQTSWSSPTLIQIKQHFGNETTPTTKYGRRNNVTVFGGAMTLATPADSSYTGTPKFKLDLNKASVTEIRDRIEEVYSISSADLTPGLTTVSFASRLAANIATYRRNDNKVAQVDTQYGLAPLPFISEVYSQRYYGVTNPVSGAVEWTAAPGSVAGFAIELSNPFPFPIKLDNVYLHIPGGPLAGYLLTTLAPTIAQIEPGKPVILYKNSVDSGSSTDITKTFSFYSAIPPHLPPGRAVDLDALIPPVTVTWPAGADGTFEIQLRATDEGGTVIASPYQKVTVTKQSDDYIQSGSTYPLLTTTDKGYRQLATIGNGVGLNILNVTAAEFGQGKNQSVDGVAVPPDTYKASSGDLVALGTTNKTTTVYGPPTSHITADLDSMQIVIAQQDFQQVGELMHLANLGFSDTQTVAEAWAGSNDVNDFMLQFDPATAQLMNGTATSHYHVPHAQFLIDQFTTLDPNSDTIDNDGNSATDDGNERIIPGLVNVNTMPEQLLKQVLPFPDPNLRDKVAAAIVAYRTGANRFNGGANARQNTAKGISNTGELLGITDTSGPTSLISDVYGNDGSDNPTHDPMPPSVKIDFLSNASPTLPDGIKDDREEKSAIARWLSQVGSVRSDHFIAYIWVRGYRSTDMTSAGLLETKRAMVVFRRNIASGAISVEAVLPSGKSFVENR
jgi:hypothetical protein